MDLSSTQTWGNSSVNICNWLIFIKFTPFFVLLTEEVRACVTLKSMGEKIDSRTSDGKNLIFDQVDYLREVCSAMHMLSGK